MSIVLAGRRRTMTLARELARPIGAVHLRIGTIEQALRHTAALAGAMDDVGCRVACAVAADNLRLGRNVIADSVNPIALTREAWRAVAASVPAAVVEVESTIDIAGAVAAQRQARDPETCPAVTPVSTPPATGSPRSCRTSAASRPELITCHRRKERCEPASPERNRAAGRRRPEISLMSIHVREPR